MTTETTTPTEPDTTTTTPTEGAPPTETPETPSEPEFVPYTPESIALPDGMTVADEGVRDEFLSLANDLKLPKETFDKLVGFQTTIAEKQAAAVQKEIEDLHTGWVDQIKNDPEIGGTKLEKNLAAVSTLLNTYGTQETRQAFDLTGAGNHPELVRFLVKISNALNEPGAPPPADAAVERASLAERMYPSMKGNK